MSATLVCAVCAETISEQEGASPTHRQAEGYGLCAEHSEQLHGMLHDEEVNPGQIEAWVWAMLRDMRQQIIEAPRAPAVIVERAHTPTGPEYQALEDWAQRRVAHALAAQTAEVRRGHDEATSIAFAPGVPESEPASESWAAAHQIGCGARSWLNYPCSCRPIRLDNHLVDCRYPKTGCVCWEIARYLPAAGLAPSGIAVRLGPGQVLDLMHRWKATQERMPRIPGEGLTDHGHHEHEGPTSGAETTGPYGAEYIKPVQQLGSDVSALLALDSTLASKMQAVKDAVAELVAVLRKEFRL